MRTLFAFFLLLILMSFAEPPPNQLGKYNSEVRYADNVFRGKTVNMETKIEITTLDGDPGNAGDPVPIDDLIPVFLLVAVGLIFFQYRFSLKVHL